MSANVGLSTPRGSGTSGYVQRNLSQLKPRDNYNPYPTDADSLKHRQRKPDQQILDHDRLREIEVKVFELRDKLEDEGVEEEEIEEQSEALRKKLLNQDKKASTESDKRRPARDGIGGPKKQFKTHQVHEQAQAKIQESERLRRALGISQKYEEGDHWRKQESRLKESVDEKER